MTESSVSFKLSPYFRSGLDKPSPDAASSALVDPAACRAILCLADRSELVVLMELADEVLACDGLREEAEDLRKGNAHPNSVKASSDRAKAVGVFRAHLDAAICGEAMRLTIFKTFLNVLVTDTSGMFSVQCCLSDMRYRARREEIIGYLDRRLKQVGSLALSAMMVVTSPLPDNPEDACPMRYIPKKSLEFPKDLVRMLKHEQSTGPFVPTEVSRDGSVARCLPTERRQGWEFYMGFPDLAARRLPYLEFLFETIWGVTAAAKFMHCVNGAVSFAMREGYRMGSGQCMCITISGPPKRCKTTMSNLVGRALGRTTDGHALFADFNKGGLSGEDSGRTNTRRLGLNGVLVAYSDDGVECPVSVWKQLLGNMTHDGCGLYATSSTSRFPGIYIVSLNTRKSGAGVKGGFTLRGLDPEDTSVPARIYDIDLREVETETTRVRWLEDFVKTPEAEAVFADWRYRMATGTIPDDLRALRYEYDVYKPRKYEDANWTSVDPKKKMCQKGGTAVTVA